MIEVMNVLKTLVNEREKLTLAIDALKHLNSFANGNIDRASKTVAAVPHKRKRRFSASTRAKMRAAQQARWKKIKARKLGKKVA